MNQLQMAITVRAANDSQWGPRDGHGRRRDFTVAELDALADFRWPRDGVKDRLAACANAILSSLRPRASNPTERTRLPSVGATSHG